MAQAAADPDANIIFGSVINEHLGDEVKITVIATGFHQRELKPTARPSAQVQVPVSAPVTKAMPPPLPPEAKKDPVRLTNVPVAAPATAPAVVRTPVSFR